MGVDLSWWSESKFRNISEHAEPLLNKNFGEGDNIKHLSQTGKIVKHTEPSLIKIF